MAEYIFEVTTDMDGVDCYIKRGEIVRCKDCIFWDRKRISCEGLARCATGEGGIRYRNRGDYCSKGKQMDGKEAE